MTRWIALLRGINVGGNSSLPMKDLREILTALGCDNPQTYIQSGNCVFDHREADPALLSTRISEEIGARFGFSPRVLLITADQLRAAIDANPYPQAVEDPKSLHFYFLAVPADKPDLDGLRNAAKETEDFKLIDQVFYLYAPEGIGRSKLAEQVEKRLGVAATARNLRSVMKIADMACVPIN